MNLLRPTKGPITQVFGERPEKYPHSPVGHPGIDYGPLEGAQIVAAADAPEVLFAGLDAETARNPRCGYGWCVWLKHANGDLTIYGHMIANSPLVNVGDSVKMGQPIGLVGNTGFSDGPHLHFEWRRGGKQAADPTPYIIETIEENQILCMAEVISSDGLNVRMGPDVNRSFVRGLKKGTVVAVYDILPLWVRIEDGFCRIGASTEDRWLRFMPKQQV